MPASKRRQYNRSARVALTPRSNFDARWDLVVSPAGSGSWASSSAGSHAPNSRSPSWVRSSAITSV
ncbi:MAG: hypothetical protein Q8L48_12090 [Archangium sp.]|nr:hypothetical protein [Archangium sp.]